MNQPTLTQRAEELKLVDAAAASQRSSIAQVAEYYEDGLLFGSERAHAAYQARFHDVAASDTKDFQRRMAEELGPRLNKHIKGYIDPEFARRAAEQVAPDAG